MPRRQMESSPEPDKEIWEDSEDEADVWSDSETAWTAVVVGEEVHGVSGEPIWDDWSRKDGSNTTWTKAAGLDNSSSTDGDTPVIIQTWQQKRYPIYKKTVHESSSIQLWNDYDFHMNPTRELDQAYDMKMEKYNRNPKPHSSKTYEKQMQVATDDVNLGREEHEGGSQNVRRSLRRESSVASSSASTVSGRRMQSQAPLSSPMSPPASAVSGSRSRTLSTRSISTDIRPKEEEMNEDLRSLPYSRSSISTTISTFAPSSGKRKRSPPRSSASSSRGSKGSTSTPGYRMTKSEKLGRRWSSIAAESGAAAITFVNEVNDEQIPPIDKDKFVYLENSYQYGKGVPKKPTKDSLWIYCQCATQCRLKAPPTKKGKEPMDMVCSCVHQFSAENGGDPHPYTSKGLIRTNTPRSHEVMECNSACACAEDPEACGNRVAQQPRQFPVEVFKTAGCGWGVRSPEEIVKGQFVGLYTGLLIPRNVRPADIAYTFELDAKEPAGDSSDVEDVPDSQKFTVDAKNYGNWTRFFNHSCDPNLLSYNVLIDTMPDQNTPFIAYYACRRIPAYTELTFDYNPGDNPPEETEHGPPPGWQVCLCGMDKCRGFLKIIE